jgi:hypothetical protein
MRRFQFRLGALFLLITFVAVTLAARNCEQRREHAFQLRAMKAEGELLELKNSRETPAAENLN